MTGWLQRLFCRHEMYVLVEEGWAKCALCGKTKRYN